MLTDSLRGMERDGNDHVEAPVAQARVVQRFAQPFREGMTEVALPAVLKVMDELAHEAAAAVSRHGGIEMQGAMFAIGAAKRLRDRAKERLGTFLAKRGGDAGRSAPAIRAKVLKPLDHSQTTNAGGWIEKRTEGGEGIKGREEAHSGARL
jgi:hypothetical protein